MTSPSKNPPRRPRPIAEGEREAAVTRLQQAYAEGHITHEEMELRLHELLTAGTRGDLARVLDTLPEEEPGPTSVISAATGRIRRGGAWTVPRTLRIESAMGRVRLDLSRAVIEHPVIDIELSLGTGGAAITVPRDAVVDIEGLTTGWKTTLYRPRHPARPGGPTIRFSGAIGFGRVRIRHAWR
ncbi:DUF1707 SHOCT-like domain-containing protein [Kitasatospora sp. Ki12]